MNISKHEGERMKIEKSKRNRFEGTVSENEIFVSFFQSRFFKVEPYSTFFCIQWGQSMMLFLNA